MATRGALAQGVEKKLRALEIRAERLERQIERIPQGDPRLDWMRAERAALDFAVDFIDAHPDEARLFLRDRRAAARITGGDA